MCGAGIAHDFGRFLTKSYFPPPTLLDLGRQDLLDFRERKRRKRHANISKFIEIFANNSYLLFALTLF